MLLMGQASILLFFPQVEEKADSIVRAVKAHVEYTNDVSFNMLVHRHEPTIEHLGLQSVEGVVG